MLFPPKAGLAGPAAIGRYLLYRHDVLHRFFCLVNGSTDELEQVEQVEHYLNESTVHNLDDLPASLSGLDETVLLKGHQTLLPQLIDHLGGGGGAYVGISAT